MEINTKVIEISTNNLYFLHLKKNSDRGITGDKWHEHTFYEILFYTEGETEYVIENRCYRMRAGDALFIKPGSHHFKHSILKSPTELFCLGFLPESIECSKIAEKIFENGEFFSLGTNSPILDMLNAASRKLEANKSNAKSFIKAISQAIILMLSDIDVREESAPQIKNGTVQIIIDFIKSNLYQIHKVSDISSALFFSDSYVRTLFKKEMNIGIMEYVRNKKVLIANRKIRQGEKPTEIYTDCGFTNYPSFYRAYTSYFGYPPKTKNMKNKTE